MALTNRTQVIHALNNAFICAEKKCLEKKLEKDALIKLIARFLRDA